MQAGGRAGGRACSHMGMAHTNLRGADWRAASTLVGPMSLRQSVMALGLASTRAYTGPLVMKSTSLGKNSLPACSA